MHAGEQQRRWVNDRPERIRERVAKFTAEIKNIDMAADKTQHQLLEARRLLEGIYKTSRDPDYLPRERAYLERKCANLEEQQSIVGDSRNALIAARERAATDTPMTLAQARAVEGVGETIRSMEERILQEGDALERHWAREPRQYVVTMKPPRLPVLLMPEEQIEEAGSSSSRWNA